MRGAELIDEIDWLIHELKPGIELSVEHYASFEAIGIDCQHDIIDKPHYGGIIRMLKHKRDSIA